MQDEKNYEHDYTKTITIPTVPSHIIEHNYHQQTHNHIDINLEYADDISKITSNKETVTRVKKDLPIKLAKRDLTINETKTENYIISRQNCDNTWKKCKLLGSLLDTELDIKRRKGLAVDAAKKLQYIFRNKKLSIRTKMRTFDIYVGSIFQYNSETWTITINCEKTIDSFHRRLLRTYVLNVKWPEIATNEKVYSITNAKPWSICIKKRRMRWLGHILRMSDDTPVRKALEYAQQPFKKPRGKPKSTWISMMIKQLANEHSLTWENACAVAQDRNAWINLCEHYV